MDGFYARIIGDKTHVRAQSFSDVKEKKKTHIKRKKKPVFCGKHDGNE